MTRVVLILCLALCAMGSARHVHPKHRMDSGDNDMDNAIRAERLSTDVDGIPVDVIRNYPPTRFVPINSVLFFKSYAPCDDGFERDFLGVCREVWN